MSAQEIIQMVADLFAMGMDGDDIAYMVSAAMAMLPVYVPGGGL